MKKISRNLLIICLILIFSLTGCSNDEESTANLEGKVETEISYLNVELIDMMNKLNNINFTNYMVESKEVSPNDESNLGGSSSQEGGGSGGESQGQRW